ncbi:hypothetical protein ACET3Z_013512 [Daucus carota]
MGTIEKRFRDHLSVKSVSSLRPVANAILYHRVHDLLCGVGNADGHLMELDVLASGGHFLSMVAAPALRFLLQKQAYPTSMIACLVQLYKQPDCLGD